MMMQIIDRRDNARASPVGDAQHDRRGAVKNGLRLPYQERIRLKKIAQRRRKKKDGAKRIVKIATLNVGTMTGRGREIVDVMQRKKVDIMCVQETRWKGQKAKEIGEGYKLYYVGKDTKRNGVGVILSPGLKDGVLQVTRMSDRIIWVQLELEKEPVNVISAYAPQVGCNEEEKEEFRNLLGGLVAKIPEKDTVWIGADLNGHVEVGNQDASKAIGKYGVGERNDSGDRIVEFAMANELAVVNTYFKKRSSRCITYASGGKEAQVDYILCRRRELKTVQDCKVLPNEAVAKQHKLVISKLELETKCRRKERRTRKTRWWKLNDDEHRKEFVRKVEEELDQGQLEDVPWEVVSNVLRIAAKETLGETSGKAGRKEETWWWNEEVQKAVEKKKEKKRMRDLNRCEKTIEEYKKANKEAKKAEGSSDCKGGSI